MGIDKARGPRTTRGPRRVLRASRRGREIRRFGPSVAHTPLPPSLRGRATEEGFDRMQQGKLPPWESELVDQAIDAAEQRDEAKEAEKARRRAVQLAREQGYHRLAVAIDRPPPERAVKGQLSLFPTDVTLFDDAG